MDLTLTDEQKLVRETTERVINDSWSLPVVRELVETGDAPGAHYQATAAELGWFSMLVDEERGGGNVSGEGLRDLAIIAEERGRTLEGAAFIPTNVVAQTLGLHGSPMADEVLQSLIAGEAAAAWVMGVGTWSPGSGVSATETPDGWRLSGQVRMVQDAPLAQWLLVTAETDGGPGQWLISAESDGVSVTPQKTLDITQTFGSLNLNEVLAEPSAAVGTPDSFDADTRRQFDAALALIVAETVGAADALFALTVEYVKDRTAFGRPIGSFQALKHQLADLGLNLEAGKSISVEATRAVQVQSDDASAMISIAKAWVSDAAVDMAQGCLQLFGGIGYTWEHDLHLFLRRLSANSLLYGGSRYHRQRLWGLQPASRDETNA